MKKVFLTVWKIFSWLVVSAIIALTVLLVGTRFLGFQLFTVLSGSMEPELPVGSVIYVRPVEAQDIRVRDVITFRLENGANATHRVVEVMDGGGDLQFRTKGDANPIDDAEPVSAEQLIGRPVFHVPCLGYLVTYMQTPKGTYTAMAAAAGLLILAFLPDLFFSKEKNKNEHTSEEETQ